MKQHSIIAPSILSANMAKLGDEINTVIQAGAEWVHVDVMDNHFVPNLTMGPLICKSLREFGITHTLDVHLMIEPVDALIEPFAKAGASYITFHPEATPDTAATLALIKSHNCKTGLAINPETPLSVLDEHWDNLDLIIVMSVNPGFGGQSFIPHTMDKLRQIRSHIDQHNLPIRLEIDGGVKLSNIKDIHDAGADTFVMGSAIFHAEDMSATTAEALSLVS